MAYPPPPYKDALTGTPLTGEAITGTWWVYPSSAGLQLGGVAPELIIEVGEIAPAGLALGATAPTVVTAPAIPAAGLQLGGVNPKLVYPERLFPAPAGLALGGVNPRFKLSQTLHVSDVAGLGLGTYVAAASIEWLLPEDCIDMPLTPVVCAPVALTPATCTDLPLEPAEAR